MIKNIFWNFCLSLGSKLKRDNSQYNICLYTRFYWVFYRNGVFEKTIYQCGVVFKIFTKMGDLILILKVTDALIFFPSSHITLHPEKEFDDRFCLLRPNPMPRTPPSATPMPALHLRSRHQRIPAIVFLRSWFQEVVFWFQIMVIQ